jgi:hypothetical protein
VTAFHSTCQRGTSIEAVSMRRRRLPAIPTSIPCARCPTFDTSSAESEERQREALDAFRGADGPHLLGLPSM